MADIIPPAQDLHTIAIKNNEERRSEQLKIFTAEFKTWEPLIWTNLFEEMQKRSIKGVTNYKIEFADRISPMFVHMPYMIFKEFMEEPLLKKGYGLIYEGNDKESVTIRWG